MLSVQRGSWPGKCFYAAGSQAYCLFPHFHIIRPYQQLFPPWLYWLSLIIVPWNQHSSVGSRWHNVLGSRWHATKETDQQEFNFRAEPVLLKTPKHGHCNLFLLNGFYKSPRPQMRTLTSLPRIRWSCFWTITEESVPQVNGSCNDLSSFNNWIKEIKT